MEKTGHVSEIEVTNLSRIKVQVVRNEAGATSWTIFKCLVVNHKENQTFNVLLSFYTA